LRPSDLHVPDYVPKNFIEDPFNQLNSPHSIGNNCERKREEGDKAVDIYHAIMKDDVDKFKA